MKIISGIPATSLILIGMIWGGQTASADDLIVYPAKGQTTDQMSKDRYECHAWAVEQSGFDPTNAQPSSSAKESTSKKQRHGAAAGAAIGALAGDAAKGARIGATVSSSKRKSEANKSSEPAPKADPGNTNYQRALTACLEGRDYTVK